MRMTTLVFANNLVLGKPMSILAFCQAVIFLTFIMLRLISRKNDKIGSNLTCRHFQQMVIYPAGKEGYKSVQVIYTCIDKLSILSISGIWKYQLVKNSGVWKLYELGIKEHNYHYKCAYFPNNIGIFTTKFRPHKSKTLSTDL
jgi:hypothetical protein